MYVSKGKSPPGLAFRGPRSRPETGNLPPAGTRRTRTDGADRSTGRAHPRRSSAAPSSKRHGCDRKISLRFVRSRSIRRNTDESRGARAKNETRRAVRTTRWARGQRIFKRPRGERAIRAGRVRAAPGKRPADGPAEPIAARASVRGACRAPHGVRPWPLAVLSAVGHFAVPHRKRRLFARAGPSNGVRAPRLKNRPKTREKVASGPRRRIRAYAPRPPAHRRFRACLAEAPRTLVCRDVEHEVRKPVQISDSNNVRSDACRRTSRSRTAPRFHPPQAAQCGCSAAPRTPTAAR